MKKFALVLLFVAVSAVVVVSQPRPVPADSTSPQPAVKPAPASFEAKYEGGMYGFSDRMEGTLKFEDENGRLAFYGKDGKEVFGIPYRAMLVVFPQSKSVQSTTGRVVSAVPIGGLLGGFIKEKRRYLVINFDDPDVRVQGLVNFKIEDRELLDSVVATLGKKAELKQRGDSFYRPKAGAKPADDTK